MLIIPSTADRVSNIKPSIIAWHFCPLINEIGIKIPLLAALTRIIIV